MCIRDRLLIFGSPSEKELRKENSKLQAQYNVLSRRLDEAMGCLLYTSTGQVQLIAFLLEAELFPYI